MTIIKKRRSKLQRNLKSIFIAEFIGSFLLICIVTIPNIFEIFEKETYNSYFGNIIGLLFCTFIARAIWTATGIWVILIWLNKISCNLNPTITLLFHGEYNLSHQETTLKIIAQFYGAIIGILFCLEIYLLCLQKVPTTIGAIQPGIHQGYFMNNETLNIEPIFVNKWWYYCLQIILEYITTMILLIFVYLARNKKWQGSKTFIIWIGLVIAITLGYRTGNIAINPAKTFSAGIISGIWNLSSSTQKINEGAAKIMPFLMMAEFSAGITMMKYCKKTQKKGKKYV